MIARKAYKNRFHIVIHCDLPVTGYLIKPFLWVQTLMGHPSTGCCRSYRIILAMDCMFCSNVLHMIVQAWTWTICPQKSFTKLLELHQFAWISHWFMVFTDLPELPTDSVVALLTSIYIANMRKFYALTRLLHNNHNNIDSCLSIEFGLCYKWSLRGCTAWQRHTSQQCTHPKWSSST